MNKFVSVESITLKLDNIKAIPTNAFKSKYGNQDHLTELNFTGTFEKIGSHAFNNLDNLRVIRFEQVEFNKIPAKAFEMKYKNESLVIDFSKSPKITSSAFEVDSSTGINRPTKLILGEQTQPKHITYLTEKVFLPFLLDNEKNTIDLNKHQFDCTDCRNIWLRNNSKHIPRVLNMHCSNGYNLLDYRDFKNCAS